MRALAHPGTTIVSLPPSRLEDVWRDCRDRRRRRRHPDHGRTIANGLRASAWRVSRSAPAAAPATSACVEWLAPLMAAGNWVPISPRRRARSASSQPGAHSGWLEWQTLVDDRPDVLCAMPCGFTLERTVHEVGSCCASRAGAAGGPRRTRLRRRRQLVLQPARPAARRVGGDPRGNPHPAELGHLVPRRGAADRARDGVETTRARERARR